MKHTEQADRFVAIPEAYTRRQLNALYRNIPLKDTTFRTLRKYFNAAANLYGVITLEKLYEIISGQCPSLVTREEFLAFAEIARHECGDYYILGEDDIYTDGTAGDPFAREIIDVTLFGENIDRYIDMKWDQQGKPWYIPAKRQLLLYDDPFYCEETPEMLALRLFLAEHFKLDEPQDSAVFCEILYGTRCLNAGFTEVMNRLHEMGLEFKTEADLRKFAALHQGFHNATRMQCNRGYTPDELFKMRPAEERIPRSISLGPNIRRAIADGTMDAGELQRNILTMKMPSEELRVSLLKEIAASTPAAGQKLKAKKVGRNEPCPCGSGKKYKKCCGR